MYEERPGVPPVVTKPEDVSLGVTEVYVVDGQYQVKVVVPRTETAGHPHLSPPRLVTTRGRHVSPASTWESVDDGSPSQNRGPTGR